MNPAHHGWDGAIYTALGRGILNGLVPYADLFETKPPGMFLISALSLYLSGSIALANVLQGLVEIGIVGTLLLPLLFLPKEFSIRDKFLFVAGTFLFGLLLVAYAINQAGHFQSESFGSFFVGLYVALLFWKDHAPLRTIAASACLLFAIAIKEPFFVIAFAAYLITLRSPRYWLRDYAVPLMISLFTGAFLMALAGYLKPYLFIYLPEMIGGRAQYFYVPVWYYVFLVNYPLSNIAVFSWPLATSVVLLWCLNVLYATEAWAYRMKLLSLIALVMGFVGLIWGYGVIVQHAEGTDAAGKLFLGGIGLLFVFGWCAQILLRRKLPYDDARDVLFHATIYISAVLLMLFVMGSAGFSAQHYAFGVPIYAVLFMMYVRHAVRHWSEPSHKRIFLGVALLNSIGIFLLSDAHIAEKLKDRIVTDEINKAYAQTIDTIMDRCEFDRYLIVSGASNVPYEHTAHSPWGPGFHRIEFTQVVDWRPPPIPYLLDGYQHSVEHAQFAIANSLPNYNPATFDPGVMPPKLEQYLQEHFTTAVPPCAGQVTPVAWNVFLFRKGTNSDGRN